MFRTSASIRFTSSERSTHAITTSHKQPVEARSKHTEKDYRVRHLFPKLKFSTPANRCGVQSGCESKRSTIATRCAYERMSRRRRDWRTFKRIIDTEINLAQKGDLSSAPSLDSLLPPLLCALLSTSTSSSRYRTTMADPSLPQISTHSRHSWPASAAVLPTAASLMAHGCLRCPERSCEIVRGRTRSRSMQHPHSRRSSNSTATSNSSSARRPRSSSSSQRERPRSNDRNSFLGRCAAGATPCDVLSTTNLRSRRVRQVFGARSGPTSTSRLCGVHP